MVIATDAGRHPGTIIRCSIIRGTAGTTMTIGIGTALGTIPVMVGRVPITMAGIRLGITVTAILGPMATTAITVLAGMLRQDAFPPIRDVVILT